jgi:hypothetical protein
MNYLSGLEKSIVSQRPMTLVVSTLTSSGIVLTADSRQTYTNRAGAIRIGSDSAMKLFRLSDKCGVAISGRAFIEENGRVKDVGFFIKRFRKNEVLKGLSTKEIAEKLHKYLGDLYLQQDIDKKKKEIEAEVAKKGTELVFDHSDSHLIPYSYTDKEGKKIYDTAWIETIHMVVAGIDKDDIGRAYAVSIPKGITNQGDTEVCGVLWTGQGDVMSRMIKGIAPEAENLNFVKEALEKDNAGTRSQLDSVMYIINWGIITLQDAVDFCILMTRTTESLQRFSDGTLSSPGGIPGVGGEIDIAVISPEKGFEWLRKKSIRTSDAILSLGEE